MQLNPAISQNFREKACKFIQHKMVLGLKSVYYQASQKRQQIQRLNMLFSDFLLNTKAYPVGQLALHIKRHEDLLLAVLPVPGNPAYESSLRTANELIAEASKIIDTLNLNDIV